MSHAYKIFDQNAFASIARCECREDLQLCFGNIALMLKTPEFLNLARQIEQTYHEIRIRACKCQEQFMIHTSVKNMAFMFNFRELSMLREVMQNTLLLFEVDGILSKHNK
jgi:hypothetical protein